MQDLLPFARTRLRQGADAIAALVRDLPPDVARWAPAPEAWSTTVVLAHLADEEIEDFRARVRLTLQDPAAPWPGIDPPRWAVERGYAGRDPAAELQRFLDERARSLEWLADQSGARWDNAYQHPRAGPLSARLLLANWLAHDLLHLRQLARLQHGALAARGEPLGYAGPLA
jgi:hypothetical protein